MEVLLNMTKRMNRKMMTSLPTLSIGLTSMIRLGGAGLERLGDLGSVRCVLNLLSHQGIACRTRFIHPRHCRPNSG